MSKTPKMAVAELASKLRGLESRGILYDASEAIETLEAGISTSNPKRMDVAFTVRLNPSTRVVVSNHDYNFIPPTPSAGGGGSGSGDSPVIEVKDPPAPPVVGPVVQPDPGGLPTPPAQKFVTDGEFHGWSVFRKLNENYSGPLINVRVVIPGDTTGGSIIPIYPGSDGYLKLSDIQAASSQAVGEGGNGNLVLTRIYDQGAANANDVVVGYGSNYSEHTHSAVPFWEAKTTGGVFYSSISTPLSAPFMFLRRIDAAFGLPTLGSTTDWGMWSLVMNFYDPAVQQLGARPTTMLTHSSFVPVLSSNNVQTWYSALFEASYAGVDCRSGSFTPTGMQYQYQATAPVLTLHYNEVCGVSNNNIDDGFAHSYIDGVYDDTAQRDGGRSPEFYGLQFALARNDARPDLTPMLFAENWMLFGDTGPYAAENISQAANDEIQQEMHSALINWSGT